MNIGEARLARSKMEGRRRKQAQKRAKERDSTESVSLLDLRPGDEVVLRWNGYRGVPQSLSMTRAKYIGPSGKRLAVQAIGETVVRLILLSQIRQIVYAARTNHRPIMIQCPECYGDGEIQSVCDGCGLDLTEENVCADDDATCLSCAKESEK